MQFAECFYMFIYWSVFVSAYFSSVLERAEEACGSLSGMKPDCSTPCVVLDSLCSAPGRVLTNRKISFTFLI